MCCMYYAYSTYIYIDTHTHTHTHASWLLFESAALAFFLSFLMFSSRACGNGGASNARFMGLGTQRLQYPLIREYTLNHIRDPYYNLRYIP